MYGVKLLVFFACLSWSQCKLQADKYCALCSGHTMCKYQGVSKKCEGEGESGVSEKDKSEITAIHNWLRGLVASGAEKRGANGAQPKAANLMKIEWDDDLAEVAQKWADQCDFSHDTCRDDPRWKVGQNIYWAWKYPNHHPNWTEAILSWYGEVSLYDSKNVNSYRFESATGHYTQMLWHETSAIGCGRKDYGANKIYVCNYGPAGNWVGDPMYDIGEPCSKCPENSVCDSYLCVKQKSTKELEKPSTFSSNFLRTLDENTGNETGNLEALKPPVENAEDVYASEKAKLCENQNQTQQNQDANIRFLRTMNDDLLSNEENQKTTINSIDENEIELDSDIKRKIEEITHQVEELVKAAIKKSNAKH